MDYFTKEELLQAFDKLYETPRAARDWAWRANREVLFGLWGAMLQIEKQKLERMNKNSQGAVRGS